MEILFVSLPTRRSTINPPEATYFQSFRLDDHKANLSSGHLSVEATKGSGIRRFLRFTRSAYIESAVISTDLYSRTVNSLLFSVWREEIGTSGVIRFGRVAATVIWDDEIAADEQGISGLFHLLGASKMGWSDAVHAFTGKSLDEVRICTNNHPPPNLPQTSKVPGPQKWGPGLIENE